LRYAKIEIVGGIRCPGLLLLTLKACRAARLRQGALVAQINVPDRNTKKSAIAAMVRTRVAACLLAALFAGGLASCSKSPPQVKVVMLDYRFIPDHLTFEQNVRYRLHLENHGKETHEFTAPTFFASADIDNPGVLNPERSEILMQPGDVKDLYLTPRHPGTYDLRCADHDWAGMVGGITVK
jgi:uncharacterized cupredoxin-like copper-binding protein